MKQCPTCGSSYTDDTLVYCLQDGATLQSAGAQKNPLSMIATLHDDAQADADRTNAIHTSSAPTIEISGPALETVVNNEARATDRAATNDGTTGGTNVTRAVAVAVVGTILLLTLGGVGAWMFFRGAGDGRGRGQREAQENANSSQTANEANSQGSGDNRGDKGGRWFVVLGAFPKDEIGRATERMDSVRKQGFDARVVSSDDYPNMKAGQWLLVMGPFTRNRAEELLEEVRPKFKDAYTKSGW